VIDPAAHELLKGSVAEIIFRRTVSDVGKRHRVSIMKGKFKENIIV